MRKPAPAWYILLYHDVSWEENCYLRSVGGTCAPDVFRQHVKMAASLGDLVSVADGQRMLESNSFDRPAFSFWFDDGLIGVCKHAKPVLDEFGVTGAVSICSRFVRRSEFFWRFKLSYLHSVDGLRFLRSRLAKHGFSLRDPVSTFTLDSFSAEILQDIDDLWCRFTTPAQRQDAYRMFMSREEIRHLFDYGWEIANHTAGHYPVFQEHSLQLLSAQFQECEEEIQGICGRPSRYWVVPFDRKNSADGVKVADACRGDRHLVYVGNRRNNAHTCSAARVLFRYSTETSAERLAQRLRKA